MKPLSNKHNPGFLTILAVFIFLAGCAAQVTSSASPQVNFESANVFYIIPSKTDSRGLHRIIQGEFSSRGKRASSGSLSSIPEGTDIVVTYHENWVWDLGWYLTNLLIQFRDPKTNVLLSSALSNRPSLGRAAPEVMTKEVLDTILK